MNKQQQGNEEFFKSKSFLLIWLFVQFSFKIRIRRSKKPIKHLKETSNIEHWNIGARLQNIKIRPTKLFLTTFYIVVKVLLTESFPELKLFCRKM